MELWYTITSTACWPLKDEMNRKANLEEEIKLVVWCTDNTNESELQNCLIKNAKQDT